MESSSYPPGTPSWVDVSVPDVDAAIAFYAGLFGWEAHDLGAEAGGYRMLSLDGKTVAGLAPLPDPSMPPHWMTYFSVASAADTFVAATGAGATARLEPMDVLGAGVMAVLCDPAGAAFAIWQPQTHPGAQVAGEPGSMCWHELTCRDVEGAKAFYGPLFGWGAIPLDMPGVVYTQWELGGAPVGGMIQMDEHWPPEIPPHWMVYFAVADCDATAARVTELGGTVSVPPTDIAPGRFAVVSDPGGAYFSVIALAPAPEAG